MKKRRRSCASHSQLLLPREMPNWKRRWWWLCSLIRYCMFEQLCVSHSNMSTLPQEKLARLQLCCCHGSTRPHVSSDTNKYNSWWVQRRPFVAAPVRKLLNSSRSSLFIPIHREDYIILHHATWWSCPSFCALRRGCLRALDPLRSTRRCQSQPALSPPLICWPIPSVPQQ